MDHNYNFLFKETEGVILSDIYRLYRLYTFLK